MAIIFDLLILKPTTLLNYLAAKIHFYEMVTYIIIIYK